ncbi:MAG: hypothetical protein A2521_04450 [Deltaproteobacteria bacterium RIFOXYD12_FULL_57_12]|nr:MAG: hypothetical protein A2521_04450 [Deltaproteobacteria bacterium RIFOXYD12_FULL_57_12]
MSGVFVMKVMKAMTRKKRNKIKFCLEDYISTLSAEEKWQYMKEIGPLEEIIYSSGDDEEIMLRAREFDAEHGTDTFSQAVNLVSYCIACHKFECNC